MAAGAEFFQTQAVYDVSVFEKFMEKARRFGVPIQYGIVIIKSPEMAKYMNEHVSGVRVPDSIIEEMASVPKEATQGKGRRDLRRGSSAEIAPMVQGIHFMPLGWSDVVPDILEKARIQGAQERLRTRGKPEKRFMTGR